MGSRAKWLFGALTCLVAVLTATTFAQAVDQTSKNGCTSPQAYLGALTSPSFNATARRDDDGELPGLVRDRSSEPVRRRHPVEYSWTPARGSRATTGSSARRSRGPVCGGGPGRPRPAVFEHGHERLPPSISTSASTFRCRWRHRTCRSASPSNTNDQAYQGFRGVGIDQVSINSVPAVSENFEAAAPTWSFDPASGPGGPFWQIIANPQNIASRAPRSIRTW